MENVSPKLCLRCKGPMPPPRHNAPRKYCSKKCRRDAANWTPEAVERRRLFAQRREQHEARRAWKKTERGRRSSRLQALRKHGITEDIYEAVLVKQRGGCAICGLADSVQRRLAVDHCHKTGKFRALLCSHCNLMIGHAKDDPSRLRDAARYLERHRGS